MEIAVEVNPALAGFRQHQKLMAVRAADGSRFGPHRNRLEAQAREGAEIAHEHLVVGMLSRLAAHIEGIGILHQKLTPPHHAKARPYLVAEFPLDMVEVARQVLVALHALAKD